MVKTLVIPDAYKYVVDRAIYEMNMRTKNLAFMLDKNLDNPEFLNSDLYKRLEDDAIDSYINRWVILNTILNTLGVPIDASLSMDYITGKYSLTWVEEQE